MWINIYAIFVVMDNIHRTAITQSLTDKVNYLILASVSGWGVTGRRLALC